MLLWNRVPIAVAGWVFAIEGPTALRRATWFPSVLVAVMRLKLKVGVVDIGFVRPYTSKANILPAAEGELTKVSTACNWFSGSMVQAAEAILVLFPQVRFAKSLISGGNVI